MMSKKPREAHVRASSHVARRNLPSPFSPHRIRGCSILFSLYTISGDFFPLGQTLPLGDLESASTFTSLPCSRVATISHLLWHIPHTPLFSIPITPLLYKKRFLCFLYRKADICFDYPFHIKPHIPCILVKLVLRTEEIHGVSARTRPVRNFLQTEGERI